MLKLSINKETKKDVDVKISNSEHSVSVNAHEDRAGNVAVSVYRTDKDGSGKMHVVHVEILGEKKEVKL